MIFFPKQTSCEKQYSNCCRQVKTYMNHIQCVIFFSSHFLFRYIVYAVFVFVRVHWCIFAWAIVSLFNVSCVFVSVSRFGISRSLVRTSFIFGQLKERCVHKTINKKKSTRHILEAPRGRINSHISCVVRVDQKRNQIKWP